MTKSLLTQADFERAAKRLRCDIPSIRAVDEVESKGKGFYADGFPTILFERHIFRKYTKGRYNRSHPHLSGEQGGYGAAGANQRRKFNEAFALDPEAAMMACSWGRYQIMGFNHAVCGYATVGEFVDAMKESEGKQLDAFVTFVIKNRLDKHLRNRDWASFAEGYNGKGYRENKYDSKMAIAYRRYSAILSLSAADAPTTNPQTIEQTTDDTTQTASDTPPPTTDPATSPPVQVTTGAGITNWLFSGGALASVGASVWAWVTSNASVVAIAVICVTVLILAVIFRKAILDAIRLQVNADPNKHNVT